jgi:hypothetical protein
MRTILMKRKVQTILMAGGFGWVAQMTLGAIFYVSPNGSHTSPFDTWEKAATNIQAATAMAAAFDQVLVTNGVYSITSQIAITNALTLESVNGPAVTVIQANRQNRCVWINATNAMVRGFTLTGGNAESAGEYPYCGGGALIRRGGISNCFITGNSAGGMESKGGGVYLELGGMVKNCIIASNQATYCGGGVAIYGGTVRDCVISNNVVANGVPFPFGGGIYAYNPWFQGDLIIVENSVIVNNRVPSGQWGGAGGVFMNGGCTLNRCVVSGNQSSYQGGGVLAHGNLLNIPWLIVNCLIANNTAGEKGGGLWIQGFDYGNCLNNCTIVGNRSACGGGVYFNGAPISVYNSILYYNTATVSNGSDNYNSDVRQLNLRVIDNCSQPAFLNPLGTEGNIADDPLLVYAAAGNFRLQPGSPCIDKGCNEAWRIGLQDLDAKTRIINNVVDMGAYEYGVDPNQASATNFNVHILEPIDNSEFLAPANVYCDMHAYALGERTITQTVILANSEPILVSPTGGVTYVFKFWNWTNVAIGCYTLTFGAWNDLGEFALSTPVTVKVFPDKEVLLGASLLQPMDGQEYAATNPIYFDARADLFSTNAAIAITQTVILANSVPILVAPTGGVASVLKCWAWTNAEPGEYELTYVAWANGGYTATSTPVNVSVVITDVYYTAGDFDYDGKDDPIASGPDGAWHIWFSSQQFARSPATYVGYRGKPLAGDFDFDGKADAIVVDMTMGYWWIWFSSQNYAMSPNPCLAFPGLPAVGDYDRDGKDDAIVSDTNGAWHIWFSGQGYAYSPTTYIGFPGTPAVGDFDGDRFDDAIVVDEPNGNWYVWCSSLDYITRSDPMIGVPGAPVIGDFDGDRFSDAAIVNRYGQWYIQMSSLGYAMIGPYPLNPYAPR